MLKRPMKQYASSSTRVVLRFDAHDRRSAMLAVEYCASLVSTRENMSMTS